MGYISDHELNIPLTALSCIIILKGSAFNGSGFTSKETVSRPC